MELFFLAAAAAYSFCRRLFAASRMPREHYTRCVPRYTRCETPQATAYEAQGAACAQKRRSGARECDSESECKQDLPMSAQCRRNRTIAKKSTYFGCPLRAHVVGICAGFTTSRRTRDRHFSRIPHAMFSRRLGRALASATRSANAIRAYVHADLGAYKSQCRRCFSSWQAMTPAARATAAAGPITGTTTTAWSNDSLTGRLSGIQTQSNLNSLTQRRSIFIQTQTTPNPASLMFLPGKPVYVDGPSINFASAREAMRSPLAKRLFQIDGVTSVFFASEYITVTKSETFEWGVLKPEVFAAVMDFYASGDVVVNDADDESLNAAGTQIHEDDDEIVAMIKELLETRIRPAVAEDGGDIIFRGWDEKTGTVTVKMQGACDGCPSSSVTLKSGIENMLRHYVPEVNDVVQEEEVGSMDLLDMATMNR